MEAGGQTEVAQLDMALLVSDGASVNWVSLKVFKSLVHQYVVRLDVSVCSLEYVDAQQRRNAPVNEAKLMHGFYGEHALADVEPSNVL